jgi:HEAT repeat protein
MRMTMTLLLLSLAVVAGPAAQPPTPAGQPPMPEPAKLAVSDTEIEELVAKTLDRDANTAADALAKLVDLGPTAVPVLTQGLWSDAATTRRACAAVLGEMGGDARPAAPSLARLLNDNSNDVRRAAARALGSIGAHSAIPALTKSLKDEFASIRLAAAESLIVLGAPAETILPALTKALDSRQIEERLYAVRLLGDLGPEAAPAVIAIQKEMSEGDALMTARAVDALGRIGSEAKNAAVVLKEKMKEDPNAVLFRVPAALALWRITRDPFAVDVLRDALAGKKNLRPLPHNALWRIDQSKETADAFAEQLKSKDPLDVYLAAEVLGGRAKDVVPQYVKPLALLAGILKGDPPPPGFNEVQAEQDARRAMSLLALIGTEAKAALEPLATLVKMKNPLSFPAAVAVYRIDPKPDNALAIAAYLEDKDHRVRAAEALKQLRPTGQAVAIEVLVALEGPDEELRLNAAVALWRIEKNASALKTMTKLLRSTSAKVREQAAVDLGYEFGASAKPAVPDLVKRLFDARAGVRSTAAEALGRIGVGARDAAPALLTVLDGDEPAYVHSAACEALGLIDPADKEPVVAELKQKLEHPAPLVRAHAALALVVAANDKSGQEEAVRGLTSRSHQVRITAAEALWRINKDGRCVPLLVRALEESNLTGQESENERYMAVRALGRIGNDAKIAVSELLKLIRHHDDALATAARTALKQIDPEAAKNAGIK